MKYIADSNGYLKEVSFGAAIVCGGVACKEYGGEIPSGYDSLEAWFAAECECLYQWKIVEGNLERDSSAVAPDEPDTLIIESGEAIIPFYTDKDGKVTVQFERTFPAPPSVVVSNVFNTKPIVVLNEAVTETQFQAFVERGFAAEGTRPFKWVAVYGSGAGIGGGGGGVSIDDIATAVEDYLRDNPVGDEFVTDVELNDLISGLRSELEARLDNLDENVSTLETKTTGLEERTTALETKVDTGSRTVSEFVSDVEQRLDENARDYADDALAAAKKYADEAGGIDFTTDETLVLENGVLRVNTADEVADNTLPITAAAVHVAVGNIESLLATI